MPFQIVLLNKRHCPGCTMPLDKAGKRDEFREGKVMVQCKCKRRYVWDQKTNLYKRASIEEEKEFLNNQRRAQ